METKKYICPVCGWNEMPDPPENDEICPCCGTHFAYDDYARSHADLRERWQAKGSHWWSNHTAPPPNWSAATQLENISVHRQPV